MMSTLNYQVRPRSRFNQSSKASFHSLWKKLRTSFDSRDLLLSELRKEKNFDWSYWFHWHACKSVSRSEDRNDASAWRSCREKPSNSEKTDVSDDASLQDQAWFARHSVHSDSDTEDLVSSRRKVHIADQNIELPCSLSAQEIDCNTSLAVKSVLADALFSSAWSKTDENVLWAKDFCQIDKRDTAQQ